MTQKRTIAFIPVRGGSKSIPNKNIRLINGKPLVYWNLSAAHSCNSIDEIFVATDSEDIKRTVESFAFDKVKVVGRSEAVSSDTASTEAVMLEFVSQYHDFDTFILIQATSPLLTATDLQEGIQKFTDTKANSLLSVVRQKRFLWEPKGADGFVCPSNYDYLHRPRRQEFEGFLVENGAFYITGKAALLHSRSRISGNIAYYEMGEETYFELDEPSDWTIIEQLMKQRMAPVTLAERINKIRMLLMDCDGVLTDGSMYYSEAGEEMKKFNTTDGMGLQLLQEKGIKTGIITGEISSAVVKRGKKLQLDEVHIGVKNKLEVFEQILRKYELPPEQVAYIGDDINDIEVLKRVGLACSVKNGMRSVKELSHYVTELRGGEGAVREVCELLLEQFYK